MTTTASAPRRSAARTRDLILAALAEATAPITVTELAERAGVGKSTLGKHLPTLEKDGLAVRTPGGRDGRRRLPDTWQANASTTPDTDPGENTSAPANEHTEEEPDTTSVSAGPDTAPDTAAQQDGEVDVPTSATQEASPKEDSEQARADEVTVPEGQSPPVTDVPVPPAAPQPASAVRGTATATATRVGVTAAEGLNPVSGSTRLAPGELKLMVKAILDADPGEEFTATEISHLLQGRSIGAIQNNLARLAKEERAVQTCDKPRRYRSAKHPA